MTAELDDEAEHLAQAEAGHVPGQAGVLAAIGVAKRDGAVDFDLFF